MDTSKIGLSIADIETAFQKSGKETDPAAVIISPANVGVDKKDEAYTGHLAAIVESCEDAIISKSLDGTIKSWNNGAEKMFGYTATQAVGRHISIIIPREYIEEEKNILDKIRNNETIAHYEAIRTKKSGEQFYVSLTISPLKDQAGNIVAVSKIVRDITSQKRCEAELIQANNELACQNKEKEKRVAELIIANKELAFQNDEKENRAAELVIANKELAFQNEEKEKRAAELIIANKELAFQNEEKENRAAELVIANKELAFQNEEKEKRAAELIIANKELAFQNEEKENRAAELVIANKELAFQNEEKEKRAEELIIANRDLKISEEQVKEVNSETKLAEQSILNSEEKRRLIMNAALDAIICIDAKGDITFWNPKAEAIFGWKENDVMGKCLSGIIIPERHRSKHDKGLANYLKTGWGPALNVLLELSAVKRSGEEFPVELTILPIRQGDEEFFCAFIRDITERRKAENTIQTAYNEKNTILESIADAFFAVDKNWIVTYWNKHAEKVLQTPKNKILGRHLWEVFSDSIDTESYNKYQQALETNQVIHFEDYHPPLDRWYEISAYPSNNGLAVYFKDVTDRKLYEIHLSELNETLVKHSKELAISNAELEQFAYVASHDLQEPLRMVTSFLTQLEKKYGDIIDERGKKYIGFAVDGAKRMRQIILDLLEFSRVGRTEDSLEDLDLNELVNEIRILFRKQIEEKKAVITVDKLPVIKAYKAQLRQVFQNLVSNALKYTKADTCCLIRITAEELEEQWQFSVTDNGIGIETEYFDKIFIIFQRLHNKDEFSGTGMGLAVTKKIIENLGGKIWLESEEGKGSTFYFTIRK